MENLDGRPRLGRDRLAQFQMRFVNDLCWNQSHRKTSLQDRTALHHRSQLYHAMLRRMGNFYFRRRDQRLEEFLNSPDDDGQSPAQTPTITSTIANPTAPHPNFTSPFTLHSLPSPALPPVVETKPEQQKGESPHAPEAPETDAT
jgi:hypothetical protein